MKDKTALLPKVAAMLTILNRGNEISAYGAKQPQHPCLPEMERPPLHQAYLHPPDIRKNHFFSTIRRSTVAIQIGSTVKPYR